MDQSAGIDAHTEEERLNQPCYVRFSDPSQGKARERDPKLRGREISVKMGRYVACQRHLLVFFLFECIELAGPNLYKGELAVVPSFTVRVKR